MYKRFGDYFQLVSHRFRVNVTVQSCDVKQSFYIENEQIIPLSIIATLLALVMLATAIDIVRRSRGEEIKRISSIVMKCWLSFSVCTNSVNILSSKEPTNAIKPLNGMKVLSLIWIMMAHTYMTLDFRATGRLITTRELPKGFLFQIVLNASLAIETFFFLGGVLVTYTTLKKMKSLPKWKARNWIAFYVHRYVRLTPGLRPLIEILTFNRNSVQQNSDSNRNTIKDKLSLQFIRETNGWKSIEIIDDFKHFNRFIIN